MRNPAFCICENKGVDQLGDNRAADQCLCFRYIDSTISLLLKSETSSMTIQLGLRGTWAKTQKKGFLARCLN